MSSARETSEKRLLFKNHEFWRKTTFMEIKTCSLIEPIFKRNNENRL